MDATNRASKREFVRWAGIAGLTGLLVPLLISRADARKKMVSDDAARRKDTISLPENLMRGHGVLHRVLLIYEIGIRKLRDSQDVDVSQLASAAEIVRDFIHNHQEKLEENYVFPRFKRIERFADFVNTLSAQHEAGRRMTADILSHPAGGRTKSDERQRLTAAMQAFITMYRLHSAREDTELFPKLQNIVSSNEYDAMAEDFAREEELLFGERAFEQMIERVSEIERAFGIYELAQFTPK